MRPSKWLAILTLLIPISSGAATVSIGTFEAQPGDTITIPITVDTPGDIAAAAFTLNYDGTVLNLDTVESTFFDTFTNQWNNVAPLPSPMPPDSVVVDEVTYDQPILQHTTTIQTMLVGVRVQAGASLTTLFDLTFTIGAGAATGNYPITLTPTIINKTAMGYAAAGEAITPLVGVIEGQNDLAIAYPALACTFSDGTITVGSALIDTDGDGIDDNWEYSYFSSNLDKFSATGDDDFDGYTDLQEYLNFTASTNGNDEYGIPWDPTMDNAPGQTGYTMNEEEFWLMLLPAIQQGTSQ